MTIEIMTLAWDIDLPDSDKIVLLFLANSANARGICWPSIGTIATKCSKSERTVQAAIKSLCATGHLSRFEKTGRGVVYTVHPGRDCAPAANAPPQQSHPRSECTPEKSAPPPAAAAPKPKEKPKTSVAKATSANGFPRPDFADRQMWSDFLANRKKKRLANTPTAHKRFMADIARLTTDDWPPARLFEHAVSRGWGGIYDPDGDENGGGSRSSSGKGGGRVDGFAAALREAGGGQATDLYAEDAG